MIKKDVVARERVAALGRLLVAEVKRRDDLFAAFSKNVGERFTAANEFRQSLNDVQQTMATRNELTSFQSEYRNAHASLQQAVADLRTSLAVGPAELRELVKQEAQQQGRHEGIQYLTTQLLALIGAVAIIAGVVGHFL